jgi:phosphoenolpyruvate carboxylase
MTINYGQRRQVNKKKSNTDNFDSPRFKEDIELLSNILGNVIKEQEKTSSFELLERIKQASIQSYFQNSNKSLHDIYLSICHLNAEESIIIARALGHFLNIVNIVENIHYLNTEQYNDDSVLSVLKNAFEESIDKSKIYKVIDDLSIELVLTAHPTEIKRRTVIRKHNQITALLEERIRAKSQYEKNDIHRKLHAIITNLWLTDVIRHEKPTPMEEAKWGCAVIEESIWNSVPNYFRILNHAFVSSGLSELSLDKTPIKFGSWMGGDRDGNPFVTAKTTEEVVMLLRSRVLSLIIIDVKNLAQDLSVNVCNDRIKEVTSSTYEPYRALINNLQNKIEATIKWYNCRADYRHYIIKDSHCISNVSEILEPLYLAYESLKQNNASSIATDSLEDLIRKVHTFGLHLVKLDIRQEASEHNKVIFQIYYHLGLGDYGLLDEDEKATWLLRQIQDKRPLPYDNFLFDKTGQEVVDTFKKIADLPEDQFGSYVISMASKPSDVLSVVLLQKAFGIKKPLPAVPLFETLNDLKNGIKTMDRLFSIDWYKSYCEGKQEVMIGYSDSAKDAGKLASSWQLYQTQQEITNIAKRHGVELCFFHGRGGSIGRGGGGPIQSALLSQPPNTVNSRIKITEQGEVIHKKFGSIRTTQKNLTLYTRSVLRATLIPPITPKKSWIELIDTLSDISIKDYHAVVKDSKLFFEYFENATPINQIGKLHIGSRPTKRKNQVSLSSLRAIPWIFSWTQTRLMLPSWLGMEHSFELVLHKKQKIFKEMILKWPFFSNLIDLLNTTLSKADINISAFYDKGLSEELNDYGTFLRKKLKVILSVNKVLRSYTGKPDVDTRSSILASQYRIPYINILNLIQVHVMQKLLVLKKQELECKAYEDALMLSIAALAAGMRSTG